VQFFLDTVGEKGAIGELMVFRSSPFYMGISAKFWLPQRRRQ